MYQEDTYDSYRMVDLESRVAAASPYDLVLVLFDGLLDELERMRGHIEAKRYLEKGRSVEKCVNILNGLSSALDFDSGGDVVTGLARLYDYMIYRLTDVSVTLSQDGVDEVVGLLRELREGWEGVRDARR
jgi:flagellar protein FliS